MRSSPWVPTAVKAEATTRATSPTAKTFRRDGGYALLELVLALAVMGLVAAVALPRAARAPGTIELRATAEQIAALLRSDRNTAIRERRDVLAQVDVENGAIASGSLNQVLRIPAGVRIEFLQSSREVGGDDGGIRFLPDGRSSGGVVTIARDDTAYSISVNWLTASVLVAAADT